MERLQKFISRAGVCSRRAAEQLILAGRVTVNGAIAKELGTKVSSGDRISVDGKILASEEHVYLLLYKPKGVVTTLNDPQRRRTVADLIKDVPQRVFPVGRLDYNTEGLLLFTNDGELTNALIHPRYKINKTYLAEVMGIPGEKKLNLLRTGIKLSDGFTSPAQITVRETMQKDRSIVEITIHEGRNRQVRRMLEAIGHPVLNLKRTTFAFLNLKGLKRGQYRHLSPHEIEKLKILIKINNNKNP